VGLQSHETLELSTAQLEDLTQLRQRELPLCLGYLVSSMFLLFFSTNFDIDPALAAQD
jgi:hypothetical protein